MKLIRYSTLDLENKHRTLKFCELIVFRTNLSNFFLFRNCSTGHLITQENHPTSHRSHMYHMGEVLEKLNNEKKRHSSLISMSVTTGCFPPTDDQCLHLHCCSLMRIPDMISGTCLVTQYNTIQEHLNISFMM